MPIEGLRAELSRALAAPDPLAKLIQKPIPGVFTFQALTPTYCKRLARDLARFESAAPNTMNRYGHVLSDIGYGELCRSLLANVVAPLARRLYPAVGRLRSYHGFTVSYSSKQRSLDRHFDASDVTLNICLSERFTGGKLVFHDGDAIAGKIDHGIGTAILHMGDHEHQAQNIRTGKRTNLILWCRTGTD